MSWPTFTKLSIIVVGPEYWTYVTPVMLMVGGKVTDIISVELKSISVVHVKVPSVKALTVRTVDVNWQELKVLGVIELRVVWLL